MNADIKRRWMAALRSGDYGQGYGQLRREDNYCCLGVLCELAVQDGIVLRRDSGGREYQYGGVGNTPYDWATCYPPREVVDWAGLPLHNPRFRDDDCGEEYSLASLNDQGKSFDEIATVIGERL